MVLCASILVEILFGQVPQRQLPAVLAASASSAHALAPPPVGATGLGEPQTLQ